MATVFEEVNPVAEVIAWLEAHPDLAAESITADHVSGVVEAPWPHIRVTPSPGGFLNDLVHAHAEEVQVEVLDHPGGTLGQAGLRRLLLLVARVVGELDDRDVTAGQTVISDVRSTSGAVWSPLSDGHLRYLTTFQITAHPGLA